MHRRIVALALFTVLGSCSGEPAGGAAASSSVSLLDADAAPADARGLEAADNDKQAVTHVRAVLLCTNAEPEACPAQGAWFEHLRTNKGKLDATLVSMVEDDRERVRSAGANALADFGGRYRSDPALALRVVSAAQKEEHEDVARALGLAVGLVHGLETGQGAALRAILKDHRLQPLRHAALTTFVRSNHAEEDLAFVAVLARASAHPEDRLRAALALGVELPEEAAPGACRHLLTLGSSAEVDVAEESILAATRTCGGSADAIVKLIGERASAGKASLSTTAVALRELLARPGSSSELLTQAQQAAMQLVKNPKNGEAARASALDLLSVEKGTRDELLGFLEKDAKQGQVQTRGVVDALRLLLEQVDLSEGQKKSALAAARAIVQNDKTEAAVRRNGLRLVVQYDPKGKAFAKKYPELQTDW